MSCCNANGSANTGAGESAAPRATTKEVFRPGVDICETKDEFVVMADVPGAREEDIDIRYEEGTLSISARVGERGAAGCRALLQEYGVGNFERLFRIGDGVNVERICAEVKNGVLTLRVPKSDRMKTRKIEVRAA